MFLSPLGERLGEGVMQETVFGLTPSPNLSPKGERSLKGEVAATVAMGLQSSVRPCSFDLNPPA